jgi:hypothetical protein
MPVAVTANLCTITFRIARQWRDFGRTCPRVGEGSLQLPVKPTTPGLQFLWSARRISTHDRLGQGLIKRIILIDQDQFFFPISTRSPASWLSCRRRTKNRLDDRLRRRGHRNRTIKPDGHASYARPFRPVTGKKKIDRWILRLSFTCYIPLTWASPWKNPYIPNSQQMATTPSNERSYK